jgi:hypothetical protein
VFKQFSDRRNFIVHRKPEETNVNVSVPIESKINTNMSLGATVIQADGTVEPRGTISKSPAKQPEPVEQPRSEKTRSFYFSDPDWRGKQRGQSGNKTKKLAPAA